MAERNFPIHAGELSAAFLSEALGTEVTEFSSRPIGAGLVGDSARIALEYAPGCEGPESIAAKFPAADPTSRQTGASLGIYRKEVGFYEDVAPLIGTRIPGIHYAAFDPADSAFLLLMEDLGPARQGDQLAGCTLDDAHECLRQIAALHGPTWENDRVLGLDWLAPNQAIRDFAGAAYPDASTRFCEFYAGRLPESDLALCARLCAVSARLFGETAPTGPAMIHGDFRLDNILFDIRGGVEPMATLDWQTVALGHPLLDVGYFMGCGIGAELRREAEESLLATYRSALIANGGPDLGDVRADEFYARGALHGISTAVFSWAFVQRTDRSDDVFQSMARGACDLAQELDAVRYLEC